MIGHSAEGRPIEVGCTSADERLKTVLVVGGIHTGSEAHSADLALELARSAWTGGVRVPDGVRLCVLPVLNPDGIAGDVHTNARGVDLNRNWPSDDWTSSAWHPETGPVSGGSKPLSEPETRALYEHIRETRPALVLVMHCCGALAEANEQPLAIDVANRYAEAAGYAYLQKWNMYEITGEFIDAMDRLDVPAVDIEMTDRAGLDLAIHRAGVNAALERVAALPRRTERSTPVAHMATLTLHQVQPGDTMWGLAARFGVPINTLAAFNNITHPSHFVPGRVLAIPAGG